MFATTRPGRREERNHLRGGVRDLSRSPGESRPETWKVRGVDLVRRWFEDVWKVRRRENGVRDTKGLVSGPGSLPSLAPGGTQRTTHRPRPTCHEWTRVFCTGVIVRSAEGNLSGGPDSGTVYIGPRNPTPSRDSSIISLGASRTASTSPGWCRFGVRWVSTRVRTRTRHMSRGDRTSTSRSHSVRTRSRTDGG